MGTEWTPSSAQVPLAHRLNPDMWKRSTSPNDSGLKPRMDRKWRGYGFRLREEDSEFSPTKCARFWMQRELVFFKNFLSDDHSVYQKMPSMLHFVRPSSMLS